MRQGSGSVPGTRLSIICQTFNIFRAAKLLSGFVQLIMFPGQLGTAGTTEGFLQEM